MAFICLVLLVNGFPSRPFYIQGLSSFLQLGQSNFYLLPKWLKTHHPNSYFAFSVSTFSWVFIIIVIYFFFLFIVIFLFLHDHLLFFFWGLTFCWTKGKTGVAAFNFCCLVVIVVMAKPFFNKSIKQRGEKKKHCLHYSFVLCICQEEEEEEKMCTYYTTLPLLYCCFPKHKNLLSPDS
jgi:hypothetical protein